MFESMKIILVELCHILLYISNIAGIIALLFQLGKIRSFLVSFYYMRKAGLKGLLLRFGLSVEEMRLINEFIICSSLPITQPQHTNILPFSSFINPSGIGKRIVKFSDMPGYVPDPNCNSVDSFLRLPTSNERTALNALINKGLLVPNPRAGHLGLGASATNEGRRWERDFELADCVISDKFIELFR